MVLFPGTCSCQLTAAHSYVTIACQITAAHRYVNRQAKVKELLLLCCRQGGLRFATLSSQYHGIGIAVSDAEIGIAGIGIAGIGYGELSVMQGLALQ